MEPQLNTLNIDNMTWAFDLDLGLRNVLAYVSRNIEMNRAVIYIHNEKTNILYSELVFMNGAILIGDGEIYLSRHSNDKRIKAVLNRKNNIGSSYAYLPLHLENKIYGLFAVDRSLSHKKFNKKEISFLKRTAHLICTGIYQNSILATRDLRIKQLNILLEVSMILSRRSRKVILKFIALILIKYGKFDRVRIYLGLENGAYSCAVSESIVQKETAPEERLYGLGFFNKKSASDIYHIVTLENKDLPLGFIEVDNIISQTKMDESQINFLRIVGNQLAITLNNIFLMEKLQKISITDPLTDTFNYRYLMEYIRNEASRAKRFGQKFSVLLIDIDDFKEINDRHGHLQGDEALRSLVKAVKDNVRDIDVLSRYGGDEFILVAPNTNKKNALLLGKKLLQRSPALKLKNKTVRMKFSMGISTYGDDTESISKLVKIADQRLYTAKQHGKHQVCCEG
ncbi:MAG: sensor domain-containing diguanylate cyclase [bacterium]|nr:sensor domain-containing diguanylate cyclase [bacterium]